MNQPKQKNALIWLSLSGIIILLDQLSKYWVLRAIELYEQIPVIPFFNLTYLQNKGIAFSLFSDKGDIASIIFAIVAFIISILIILWLAKTPRNNRWLACALALVLGGAIGNLVDRMVHGYVVDFLLLYYQDWSWPAFNIADGAISVGALMLIIDLFKSPSPSM